MATSEDRCVLCELPVAGREILDKEGRQFCCRGCLEVYDALGDVEAVDAADVRQQAQEDDHDPHPDHESTFLEVEGMHCVSCEAFIESTATTSEAVSDARASYVTDTVRIDHDPEAITAEELRETVSGLGYTAYPRDDAFSRRQADNWAFARLGVGVLVGMLVMMQYVLIIYPTYFGGLLYSPRTALFLEEMMTQTGSTYFFVVIGLLTSVVLFFTGKPVLRGAYVGVRTRSPNMDLLVALAAGSAYLYSTLAIAVGGEHIYYDVTVAIILVVTVGNHYESTVKRRASDLLSDLTTVQVDEARRLTDDGDETVRVEDLDAGDRVLVRTGERIPIDGRVAEGTAAVDEAVVTGESLPVEKSPDERVVGGSVVTDGSLVVEVAEDATNSLDRIANLVWDLQSSSHGIQQLADKLATIFVPLVLVLAVVVASIYLAFGATITTALLVGLTVLIVSCPCALGLATPLAIASGVRSALERNVVIFDETVFERIREADTVVFDKTGTLTTGDLTVQEADAPEELLAQAAALESRSAHPAAKAIAETFAPVSDGGTAEHAPPDDEDTAPDFGGGEAAERGIDEFESHAKGVSGTVDGSQVIVGHSDLFDERGWAVPERLGTKVEDAREDGTLPIVVGRDGAAEGVVVLGDEFREGWDNPIRALDERGVEVVVLTGDDERATTRLRDHAGVDRVFAGVPPEGKAETVARIAAEGQTVMVGDGTNDAPALARADLGIALGGGTAMAVDAADVAIVDDDLGSIETVFDLASATDRRIKENIGWAFCYNGIAIPIAVAGLLNPLFAAVAMAISSTLVVTNSSRSLLSE